MAAPRLHLGINTCFAVTRWPEPSRWVELVVDEFGLDHCQLSLDLVEPGIGGTAAATYAELVRQAAGDAGLTVHSVFTGLAAYSTNLLLHPARSMREAATDWFERAIEIAATAGAAGAGGYLGALSVADAADRQRRRALLDELGERLGRLAEHAKACGLEFLLMENMAVRREPGSVITEAHELETLGGGCDVPWVLCLDLGHPCALHTGTASDDPVAWLEERWRHPPVLQLQQANRGGDHHWPFTPARNEVGLLHRGPVVDALRHVDGDDVYLFLEVIHPHEADDDVVLAELRQSVAYWREAIGD